MSLSFVISPIEMVLLRDGVLLGVPPHKCTDSLEWREAISTEPHGECFEDAGYVCTQCGERFTASELATLSESEER